MSDTRTVVEEAILKYATSARDCGDDEFAGNLEIYAAVLANVVVTALETNSPPPADQHYRKGEAA
tara:strand:- start:257 stop:451 length:195 start_codon:yes stop_codon:yes gene_type:complete